MARIGVGCIGGLLPAVGLRARWWASPYGSFSVGGGLTLLGELVPDGGVDAYASPEAALSSTS